MAVEMILELNPEASYNEIARVLNRTPASIGNYVAATRDMLRLMAPEYLKLHHKAATIAAADGDAGPAQWALERIDHISDDGTKVRVVEPVKVAGDQHSGSMGTTINVGINLSQVAATAQQPSVKADVVVYPVLPEHKREGISLMDAA